MKEFEKNYKLYHLKQYQYFNHPNLSVALNISTKYKVVLTQSCAKVKLQYPISQAGLRSQSTLSSKIKICQKNMIVLLHTYFYNISINALRPTFFNIYNLPFLIIYLSPNTGKVRVNVRQKTNYFYLIPSSCTNRIVVFNHSFSLIYSQRRGK